MSALISAASEWLFGVPIHLSCGHPCWWIAAILGTKALLPVAKDFPVTCPTAC